MSKKPRKMSDGMKVALALAAFFGVVFTADGILIYLGMTSHDGLVYEDYYQRGVAYDEVLQIKKQQRELGWSFDLNPPQRAGTAPLEVKLTDANGQPLSGKQIAARIRRPAQKGFDQNLTFEEIAPGTYRATVSLPVSGNWNLEARVREAQGETLKDLAIFETRFSVSG